MIPTQPASVPQFGQLTVQKSVSPTRTQDIQQAAQSVQQSLDFLDQQGIDLLIGQNGPDGDTLSIQAVNRNQPEETLQGQSESGTSGHMVDAALRTGIQLLHQSTQKQSTTAANDQIGQLRQSYERQLDDLNALRRGGWH